MMARENMCYFFAAEIYIAHKPLKSYVYADAVQ